MRQSSVAASVRPGYHRVVSDAARRLATAVDLVALGDASAEVIHGVVTYKAEPSAEHADAQLAVGAFLRADFHRASGRGGPGGWWILTEVDVELAAHEVYRPDVAGWRRERVEQRPTGRPVTILPDFVCEILSESNAVNDQVDKFRVYAANGIPYYWMADPSRQNPHRISPRRRNVHSPPPSQKRRDRGSATVRCPAATRGALVR